MSCLPPCATEISTQHESTRLAALCTQEMTVGCHIDGWMKCLFCRRDLTASLIIHVTDDSRQRVDLLNMLAASLMSHAEYTMNVFVGLFQYHKASYGFVTDEEET